MIEVDVESLLDELGIEIVNQRGDWVDLLCIIHAD